MHPIITPELIGQHHVELLRDAERQRLSATVRRPHTFTGLLRRRAHRRAGPVPS